MRVWSAVLLAGLLFGVGLMSPVFRAEERVPVDPLSKVTFSLDQLNPEGLWGPPGGLRALHYEFCIPGDSLHEAQVREIDPTVQIYRQSRGRAGCGPGEYLCLGSTHQPGFRTVLFRLACLPYVRRIDQAFFE